MSGRGNVLGCFARMPIVRSRRLLRFLNGQARDQTFPSDGTSRDARYSARRVDVVLCPRGAGYPRLTLNCRSVCHADTLRYTPQIGPLAPEFTLNICG